MLYGPYHFPGDRGGRENNGLILSRALLEDGGHSSSLHCTFAGMRHFSHLFSYLMLTVI